MLPGFVDTHVHFPQLRIIGGLGRTLLDWLEHVGAARRSAHGRRRLRHRHRASASSARSPRTARRPRWCSARTSRRPPRRSSRPPAPPACGSSAAWWCRIATCGPSCTSRPRDAYRDSTELIRRFHRHGRLLYAVTPRFALSASEAMLEMCQTLLRRARRAARPDAHQRERRRDCRSAEAVSLGAPTTSRSTSAIGLTGRAHGAGAQRPPHRRGAGAARGRRGRRSRTARAATPRSAAASFRCAVTWTPACTCALGTDVGGGTGFGMLKEGLQAYLMQRVAAGRR